MILSVEGYYLKPRDIRRMERRNASIAGTDVEMKITKGDIKGGAGIVMKEGIETVMKEDGEMVMKEGIETVMKEDE